MKPNELVGHLITKSGKSVLEVAKEIAGATFQGTLHKFVRGQVRSPKMDTARRIAGYFGLHIQAIYDEGIATSEAARLGVDEQAAQGGEATAAAAVDTNAEVRASAVPPQLPVDELARQLAAHLTRVDPAQRETAATFLAMLARTPSAEKTVETVASALTGLLPPGVDDEPDTAEPTIRHSTRHRIPPRDLGPPGDQLLTQEEYERERAAAFAARGPAPVRDPNRPRRPSPHDVGPPGDQLISHEQYERERAANKKR